VIDLSSVGVPATAESVQVLELADIRLAREAWPRAEVDADRVHEFYCLYQADGGDTLPPIEVIADPPGGFVLCDGWHRLTARRDLGAARVREVVVSIPRVSDPVATAFLCAVARSAISAKPLTRAEKQAAVLRLIEIRPGASDREIGRLAGVDHKTVGRLRAWGISPPVSRAARSVPGAGAAARKLLGAFEKIREARGLGLLDWWRGGDRTGHRLADALLDVYGDEALERARLCIGWLEQAIVVIEATEPER
jgi:hypothetical protein